MIHKQQHTSIYIPFCYLIGWSKQKKFYYGVRYKKNTTPNDLWTIYFTSSKLVKEYREKYGEPDIIQVRKTFNNVKSALKWESKVLRRLKINQSSIWLNKNIAGAILWDDELRAKVTGRVGSKKGKKMKDIRPDWVNPLKGTTAKERYKDDWVCYRKGKTIQEIWGSDYVDPRSQPFYISSNALGVMHFKNVSDCISQTKLDGISILQLKIKGIRIINRRKTTKHIFPDGDIIKIHY